MQQTQQTKKQYYLARGTVNTLYQAMCGRPDCRNTSRTYPLPREDARRELRLTGWRDAIWRSSDGYNIMRLVCPACAQRTDNDPLEFRPNAAPIKNPDIFLPKKVRERRARAKRGVIHRG